MSTLPIDSPHEQEDSESVSKIHRDGEPDARPFGNFLAVSVDMPDSYYRGRGVTLQQAIEGEQEHFAERFKLAMKHGRHDPVGWCDTEPDVGIWSDHRLVALLRPSEHGVLAVHIIPDGLAEDATPEDVEKYQPGRSKGGRS